MAQPLRSRWLISICALTIGSASSASPQAHSAVPPSDSGQVLAWGTELEPMPALPAGLTDAAVVKMTGTMNDAGFLTAAGDVVIRSDNTQFQVPPELAGKKVVALGQSSLGFGAVTAEGEAVFWGDLAMAPPASVDLSDAVDLVFGLGFGLALKVDGTVVGWGNNDYGQIDVPPGLDDVTKLVAGTGHAYALRSNGTVVAWGRNQNEQVSDLPASFATPGTVQDVEARNHGGLALLTDGTVQSWGNFATFGRGAMVNVVPPSLAGQTITQIAAGSSGVNLAVNNEGEFTIWGDTNQLPTAVPDNLDGNDLSDIIVSDKIAFGIERKLLAISAPRLAGTPKRGAVLTGTPATFSGSPTVTHQWLANGAPIAGATGLQLTLGAAQVGKTISLQSTATQGEEVVTSVSAPTVKVADVMPPKVASRTSISASKVKRGKATIKVRVVRSGGTPTGRVTIKVTRGAKKVLTKTLTLKRGSASLGVKRLKKGKYRVSATYSGDSRTKASGKTLTFRVR